MQTSLERKQAALEFKDISESGGTFTGYASVFGNIDIDNDIVAKGAFKKSLSKKSTVQLLWQHDRDQPIGILTAIEDDYGLLIEAELVLEVQQAKEAYALIKKGALNGLSIGYTPTSAVYDKITGVRTIKEATLFEVSLVTFPANPKSTVTGVKSDIRVENLHEHKRTIEAALRDAGVSDGVSRYIGSLIPAAPRDAAAKAQELQNLAAAFSKSIDILKGI